jgi:hypothetical protein
MGTNHFVRLFDSNSAKSEIEKFGFNNVNSGGVLSKRSHVPYEFRDISNSVLDTYLFQNRFNSKYSNDEIDKYPYILKISYIDHYGKEIEVNNINAYKTFNDYYNSDFDILYEGHSLRIFIGFPNITNLVQFNPFYLNNYESGIKSNLLINDINISNNLVKLYENIYKANNILRIDLNLPIIISPQFRGKINLNFSFRIISTN